MDPNAALTAARALLADCEDGDAIAGQELAEHFRALDEWLNKGGFLPDAWQRTPKVEILHNRDSDSACEHAVYVDGQPTNAADIESIDPGGSGWQQSDWEENLHVAAAVADRSPAFRDCVTEWLLGAFDSEHIEKDHRSACVRCEIGDDLPHPYQPRH